MGVLSLFVDQRGVRSTPPNLPTGMQMDPGKGEGYPVAKGQSSFGDAVPGKKQALTGDIKKGYGYTTTLTTPGFLRSVQSCTMGVLLLNGTSVNTCDVHEG